MLLLLLLACRPDPPSTLGPPDTDPSTPTSDCAPADPEVGPDSPEIPYDGVDNDCDPGTPDDDLDADGFPLADDCDDEDPAVSPAAVEDCGGRDLDCDGAVDGPDDDGDGRGAACDNCPETYNPPGTLTSSLVDAGDDVIAVAAGDFDGDGRVDLVAVSGQDDAATVYLGAGRGHFEAQPSFAAGAQGRLGGDGEIAVGDLDRDGDLDLVITADDGGSVATFANDGAGAFVATGSITTGTTPVSVALGDNDGDGSLDAVVSNTDGHSISVLHNDGTGALSVVATLGTGAAPRGVALGDLDADGDLDIANAESGAAAVVVYRNDGTGVFLADDPLPVEVAPIDLAIGELDGDGLLDVVVTTLASSVTVLHGDGTGVLTPGATVPTTTATAYALTTADVDGDGDLDLATAEGEDAYWNETNAVSVFLNDGAGGFVTAGPFRTAYAPYSVAAADLDADGDPDLVTGDRSSLSVLLGDGAGAFQPRSPAAVEDPSATAMADLDGDADLDLLVLGGPEEAAVLRNDGTGRFTTTVPELGQGYVYDATVADVDADGDPDLLASSFGVLEVWRNDGVGAFTHTGTSGIHDWNEGLATGDLDGDGDVDLVESGSWGDHAGLALNDGSGAFADAVDLPEAPDPKSIAVGDLDGDGDMDLVVAAYFDGVFGGLDPARPEDGTVSVLRNDGTGTFTRASSVDLYGPDSLALGDLDADGDLDVVAGGVPVSVYTNDGAGGLSLAAELAPTGDVALGDLDGDDDLDLLVSNLAEVVPMRNDGTGAFTTGAAVARDSWAEVHLGDLDGDVDLDGLYVPRDGDSGAGGVVLLLNDGQGDVDGDGIGDACDPA